MSISDIRGSSFLAESKCGLGSNICFAFAINTKPNITQQALTVIIWQCPKVKRVTMYIVTAGCNQQLSRHVECPAP